MSLARVARERSRHALDGSWRRITVVALAREGLVAVSQELHSPGARDQERLGFRYLATNEETPALRAIRDHERGSGLDARRARV